MLWIGLKSKKYKPSEQTGDPYAVEVVKEIAQMAEESGFKIAFYPHFNFWLETVEDAVRIIKKVDRKNVGVTFNLCHWLKASGDENMESVLELASPYLYLRRYKRCRYR